MGKQKEEEEKKDRTALLLQERKKIIYNLVLAGAASFTVLVGVFTLAWFAWNDRSSTTGVGVAVQAVPYTIQTRNSSGYYKDIYESLNTEEMEWLISEDANFENHSSSLEEDEEDPGLEPGDCGYLEFRVNPNNSNSITVNCIFDIKAYLETVIGGTDETPETEITEIDNDTLVGYAKAHIMLFANRDPLTGKYSELIDDDDVLGRALKNMEYVRNANEFTKVYWVWPEHLWELTDMDDGRIIYDSNEREDVIAYIANNKNGFFKDCNDSVADVVRDLTTLSTSDSSTIYNHYNMKYDNADLEIGNKISYVMISMQVK